MRKIFLAFLVIYLGIRNPLSLGAQVVTQTFAFTGVIQTYTVPNCVTSLTMEAWGAQGGNIASTWFGGEGAYMSGVFTVTPGQVLRILVGGQAPSFTACGLTGSGEGTGGATGGGGGSFIATITNTPLLVAGGGGGRRCLSGTGCSSSTYPNAYGIITTTAQFSQASSGAPGTNGNGGQSGEPTGGGTGGPGGGFYTNGGPSGSNGGTPGFAFVNGGAAAPTCIGFTSSSSTGGGFGGGGAGSWCWRGTPGGGGGYSGGATGVNDCGGGGGGSYNIGTNQNNITGVRSGNGQVVISYNLLATPLLIISNPPSICVGGSATLSTSGLNSYTWSTGSFTSSTVISPTVTTTYSASGTNSLGCISSSSIIVNVDGTAPIVNVISNPSVICLGAPTTLFASGANSYTISGGVSNSVPFNPIATSVYTIIGSNSCGTSSALASVSVNPLPIVSTSASSPSVCLGNTVSLIASGALSYTWSSGITNSVPFSPTVTNSYTVNGSDAFGCIGNTVIGVSVFPFAGPVIAVSPSSTFICLGANLTLSASALNSYTWSTGSNLSSFSVAPTSNTTYSVSGTNALGCISTNTVQVGVNNGPPTLTVTATPSAVCNGQSLTIIALGANNYTISGGISNGLSFVPSSGSIITVMSSNACGTNSNTTSFSVHPSPTVTAVAISPTICSGSPATVIGSGAPIFSVSGGVANNVPFYPGTSGSYTVIGYSTLGCTASAVANITVYPSPTITPISSPTLICVGNTASLIASGALTYTWLPSNSNLASINVSPTVSTTYTLIQNNFNCSNTQTVSVVVNNLPTLVLTVSPSSLCAGSWANLNSSGANTYTWTALPNYTISGPSAAVNPSASTIYTLTASDGTCTNTATLSVMVSPNPSLSIVASTAAICSGNNATLTATGASSYTWNPINVNGNTAIVSPTVSTLFSVIGLNTAGCSSSSSQLIIVNNPPNISAYPSTFLVCLGSSGTLTATGASSYQWSTGGSGAQIVVTPSLNSVYTVTGTTSSGCSSTKTVGINVYSPSFSVSPSVSVCIGGTVALSASGAFSYTWSGNYPFANMVVSPSITTQYVVSATSSSNGLNCISSNSVTVSVLPNPIISLITSNASICKGEKVLLSANGANSYSWSTGAVTNSIQVIASSTTLFSVIGTDANGCSGTSSLSLKIILCTGFDALNDNNNLGIMIYPNPSTGAFTIQSLVDCELIIVNSLGKIVKLVELSQYNKHEVEIQNIAKGMYLIVDKQRKQVYKNKIIVLD